MSDDNLGPSAPEPDSEHSDPAWAGPAAQDAEHATGTGDGEPTQPIAGSGWTSPSASHRSGSPSAASSAAAGSPSAETDGSAYAPESKASSQPPGAPSGPPGAGSPGSVSPIPAQPSPWGTQEGQQPPQMYGQLPPGQMAGHPAYARPASTTPMPVYREAQPKGRVPGWLWPVVAVLSLLVGLMGGVLGGIGYDRWDQDGSSAYNSGLNTAQPQPAPLEADNGSIAAVAQALLPSTVQIIAEFGGQDEGATGSGFVLDRDGHVVTNNHVVASAAEDDGPITVVDSDGVRHTATVVGRSPVYDLAILLIEDPEGLVPAALGASTVLHVGDPVIAFGSPLGLSQTVTSGIVSALDRPVTTGDEDNTSSYINAVQTDAAINPGNSGGPLVNLAGQVVGVNSAIATTGGGGLGGGGAGNIGVGFAIPIEQVRITADQILKTGAARYPVIGAQVRTGGAEATGALITEVNQGSPAEEAGLRKDDVVTKVDTKLVSDGIALIVAIRTHQPGETIEFTVRRNGSEETVKVTLDGEVG